ncbi:hypothetical protein KP509_29G033900 [Ceratopteris richardii]|uniref:Protein kinase domain-containing protein n=1 Tax=Ceratopteris richardii TaxID=49495 RepID=A0A8T2R7Q4_CERRI|nr:hypothetical protein KP509_29G033900 [Ceratopteris richardii]
MAELVNSHIHTHLLSLGLWHCILFICLKPVPLEGIPGRGLKPMQSCDYANQICGKLKIPYPFGMSDDCGLPPYRIHCKQNASYGDGDHAFLQIGTEITPELQVLSFSTQTISLNATHLNAINPDCSPFSEGRASVAFSKQGPFSFSRDNFFVVMGCRASGSCVVDDDDSKTLQCSTACFNELTFRFCNGYTCCITAIPPNAYKLDYVGSGECGSSRVLSPSSFTIRNGTEGDFKYAYYGISVAWSFAYPQNATDCSTAIRDSNYACAPTADCFENDDISGYNCNCAKGYSGDGYKAGIGCVAGGVGALIVVISMIFIIISRTMRRRRKRKQNFQRVGGQQLVSFLFSERELLKATANFSKKNLIGQGGFAKVYFGKLSMVHGTRKVAIKRAKAIALEERVTQMQTFVMEILLLRKAAHNNVVQLLGCCVETSVPLLVYEYVENGTVRDYLKPQGRNPMIVMQGRTTSFQSLWAWRLHVALEVAEALSYLHDLPEPIYHLDMKSDNILIDKHYNPKVADFGLACLLTSDATHLSNPIAAGTYGYVDPEYYRIPRITDKYDVYSFGVILLELLSSLPAYSPPMVLANHFRTVVNMEEEAAKHRLQQPSFIDARLESDEDTLECICSVARVAQRCVALKGSERPSIQEVLRQLKRMQAKLGAGRSKFTGKSANWDGIEDWDSNEDIPVVWSSSMTMRNSTSGEPSMVSSLSPSGPVHSISRSEWTVSSNGTQVSSSIEIQ